MTIRAIDLFAGAGGFSEGARMAGVDVVYAANHWQTAVDLHSQAHPDAMHECQDLSQADFTSVPDFDLLLASPACQGHSLARGKDRAHHDVTRSTAWAVIAAVEAKQPRALIVENVPEFQKWKLFPIWMDALRAYGYDLTVQVLDAADLGVPQNRRRVFVVGTQNGAVHVPEGDATHVTARDILELDSATWSPIRKPGRAARTIRQADAGREEFGDGPFLAPYYGSGSGLKGRSLDRPIGTIRTRDAWAVMRAGEMRMLTVSEYRRAMGFPSDYGFEGLTKKAAIHLLGNAVPPGMAAHVIEHVVEGL